MLERNFEFIDAQSMGASFNSNPVFVANREGYSIQLVWTGTPTGDFTLQGSNDYGQLNGDGTWTQITNWDTITDSTKAAGGAAGSHTYNVSDVYYRHVRVVYTRSGSTGTVDGRIQTKGTL